MPPMMWGYISVLWLTFISSMVWCFSHVKHWYSKWFTNFNITSESVCHISWSPALMQHCCLSGLMVLAPWPWKRRSALRRSKRGYGCFWKTRLHTLGRNHVQQLCAELMPNLTAEGSNETLIWCFHRYCFPFGRPEGALKATLSLLERVSHFLYFFI